MRISRRIAIHAAREVKRLVAIVAERTALPESSRATPSYAGNGTAARRRHRMRRCRQSFAQLADGARP